MLLLMVPEQLLLLPHAFLFGADAEAPEELLFLVVSVHRHIGELMTFGLMPCFVNAAPIFFAWALPSSVNMLSPLHFPVASHLNMLIPSRLPLDSAFRMKTIIFGSCFKFRHKYSSAPTDETIKERHSNQVVRILIS